MKIRNGFVSNSSSSSFVCEVCGDIFESWDEGPSHFDLVMCKDHDHLFCMSHAINPKEDETYTMYEDDGTGDGEDRIDSIHCPICQMKHITNDMALQYAAAILETKIPEVRKEMQDTFNNYDEFQEFVNEGNTYGVELKANVYVVAPNEELAHKYARKKVIESPVKMLDVTHCEKV